MALVYMHVNTMKSQCKAGQNMCCIYAYCRINASEVSLLQCIPPEHRRHSQWNVLNL